MPKSPVSPCLRGSNPLRSVSFKLIAALGADRDDALGHPIRGSDLRPIASQLTMAAPKATYALRIARD
jgi:hypothetical protein